MPRRPRVVIPDVAHHITQRGNNRQTVFRADDDFRRYLALLSRHSLANGARILAYCLMPNHVHLIVVPRHADSLALTLGRTHSDYALAWNRARDGSGHLWQNRFFSCPLDQTHAVRALRYVELSPERAGLAAAFWEWPWSSARVHTMDNVADAVLDFRWTEYFGGWNFAEWKEILSAAMPPEDLAALRRAATTGEPLGSRDFVLSLERQTGKRLRGLRCRAGDVKRSGAGGFGLDPWIPSRNFIAPLATRADRWGNEVTVTSFPVGSLPRRREH